MTLNGSINPALLGILFDKDGTLLKVEGFWMRVYQEAIDALLCFNPFSDLNKTLLDIYRAIGLSENGLVQNSLAAIGSVKEVFAEVTRILDLKGGDAPSELSLNTFESLVTEQVYRHVDLIEPMFEKTHEALGAYKQEGLKLALITTDSRENTVFMLKHLGLYDFFDYIGCGDDALPTKPSPEQGLDFLSLFDLPSHRVLMVGDSVYDEAFAGAVGCGYVDVGGFKV